MPLRYIDDVLQVVQEKVQALQPHQLRGLLRDWRVHCVASLAFPAGSLCPFG